MSIITNPNVSVPAWAAALITTAAAAAYGVLLALHSTATLV